MAQGRYLQNVYQSNKIALAVLSHEFTSKNQNNTTSSSAAIEKLSPVFCRTRDLTHWQLDDASRYYLAGLSFERFTLDARRSRIYQSNPHINFTAFCRSFNRSLEPPPSARCHSNFGNDSILNPSIFGTHRNRINIWQIVILSLCQGAINAFDAPARQAFVPEIVEKKEDLAQAIAINASMFNGARLIGPAIAGLLIATVGPSYCFLIDGLSYIAVIVGLLAMHIKPRKIAATNTKPLQRLKEGFVYSFGFPPIRAILLLLAVVSFAGMSHTVLVPIFATKILHGDAANTRLFDGSFGSRSIRRSAIYLIGPAKQSLA